MKPFKNIFLFLFLCLSIIFLVGCPVSVQNGTSQQQKQIQQLKNIYFEYPLRNYPIGRTEGDQLYWDCSDNDFCDAYNGEYHTGEDWNLKGGRNDIDEDKPVYSIGEGIVIYAKQERDRSGDDVGFRVVIEHTGNCIIPAKGNIGGSGISYEEEIVGKIYSVYLHLKDVKVKVGNEVKIDTIIGNIAKTQAEIKANTGPHLHFEIRKDSNIVYESYFENIQKIINLGFRDPSDFIEANYKSSEEYEGEEEAIEIEKEKTYKTTAKGKIAFISDRDGNSEIYIMNVDGSEQKRLTDNPGDDTGPSFSPDGSKIAFISGSFDECDDIYIMNIDGSEQVNLTNNTADDRQPCFSPDGSKIAFTSDRDGNPEIYIMNVDGTEQVNLTDNLGWDGVPSFSPEGSKIAFDSLHDGNWEIYIKTVDGSGQVNLTNNPADGLNPIFSPNGSKIAFSSWRDGNGEIYIMNIDGSDQTKLTNNPADDLNPIFSPNGSKIAFSSWRDGNSEIYIMNIDGSEQVNLTNNTADDWQPCFSPDGSKIAFLSDRDGNYEIYIMNVDGSEQKNLTNNPAFDVLPCFSP